ncbi:MAG: PrgI family protein [Patescibacteria group bacterium]
MSQYKVIQDIESEDKLLGPFSLRQFIYAAITITLLFITFSIAKAGAWFIALPFLLPIGFFGLLAAPFGHDQSSEVWLLAKIRFMLKPRKRIWDQSGAKQLVAITAPKKIIRQLTDGLDQSEVKSRLSALATTLDSRGWAVKNVNVNMYSEPSYFSGQDDSDRLIGPSALPQDVPQSAITAQDDIMDTLNNPTAHNLESMMQTNVASRRQQIVEHVKDPASTPAPNQTPQDFWFLNSPAPAAPGMSAFDNSQVVHPKQSDVSVSVVDDPSLSQKLTESRQKGRSHSGGNILVEPASQKPQSPVPATPDPAILQLANNDDLNVATIARQANKAKTMSDGDEVVISLH